jgi:hypothetical protein
MTKKSREATDWVRPSSGVGSGEGLQNPRARSLTDADQAAFCYLNNRANCSICIV